MFFLNSVEPLKDGHGTLVCCVENHCVKRSTDKKLLAAEGAAHFWWDKDFYYID